MKLDDLWYALRDTFRQGQIAEDHYFKGLLCIAREWAVLGDEQGARDRISEVTEKYLTDVMPLQMESDPEFHQLVVELARALKPSTPPSEDAEAEIDLAVLRGPTAKA